MSSFDGRAGLIQRVVPNYRYPFFNALAQACTSGLSIFTGEPRSGEMITTVDDLKDARLVKGWNFHIFDGRYYICIQLGLMNWLRDWSPDVLIVEANPRYLRTSETVRWMHRRGRPVVGWGLGAPPTAGPMAGLRITRRKNFIRQFDAMITYSQSGAAEYAALGFPQDRIFVAANAVTPPPDHPMPTRSALIEKGKAQVLFVGRLQARKKIDNLLTACAQLPQTLQPSLTIIGDGPAREEMEKLAQKIYPEAIFTGALYGQPLENQFRAADLFVLPGTGGLAIQQAMSFGLPVIAAEADGTQADLVRPGNGWQVPPSDITALQTAMEQALRDIPALRQKGAESYRIVSQEINLDRMVAVFIKALNRSMA